MKKSTLIFFLLCITAIISEGQDNYNNDYIELASGDTLTGYVRYKEPFLGSPYLSLNDSTEYKLSNVRFFRAGGNDYAVVKKMFGHKTLKCVEHGKLSLYSTTETTTSFSAPIATGPGQFSPGMPTTSVNTYSYFRKGNGPLLETDYDNLKKAMDDNMEALKLLDESKQYGTFRIVSIVAGLGLVGASFIGADKENPPNWGLMIGGAGVASLNWIFDGLQDSKMEDAISKYNH